MKAFETALTVVQNNVTNSSTPGYARQQMDLVALPFQPELSLAGGVQGGLLSTTRSGFSERAVWKQSQSFGRVSQLSTSLAQVEPVFDITGESGIAGTLGQFYAAFSQLGVTPNDVTARENVLGKAGDVARSFRFGAELLTQVQQNTSREARSVVAEINRIGNDIRDLNEKIRRDYRTQRDAGINARLYAALEELSELIDFNAIPGSDGSMTVLLGGQVPLVIGDKTFEISVAPSNQTVDILDYQGTNVGSRISGGKLGGLMESANTNIPSYMADLNQLAQTFADRVNTVLAGGLDLNGQPPAVDLFTYDAVAGAALTLNVTSITPEQIAAAEAGSPGGNGNALTLAGLSTSQEIAGFTFTEFYGKVSADVGRDLAAAREDERTQALVLSQMRALRDEVSGVNLDLEAAQLVEYQRGYQAAGQMISVIHEMTDEVFRILR